MPQLTWASKVLLSSLLWLIASGSATSFHYSTPPGFFLQEDPSVNPSPPDYVGTCTGLISNPL